MRVPALLLAGLLVSAPEAALVPIPDPDLTGAESQVAAKISAARRYAERHPESGWAWGVLGMNLDVHGFPDEALACYEQASRLEPGRLEWTYYRAILLAAAGSPGALDGLRRARELAPANPPLLVRLGEASAAAGDPAAAAEAFAAAAAAAPGLSHAHLGLARLALARGDLDESALLARRALAADPLHGEARGLLAEIYRRRGQLEEARTELALLPLAPRVTTLDDPLYRRLTDEGVSSVWYRRRGRAWLEAGEPERAARELEHAVRAAARPEIYDDLGLALLGSGRVAEAADAFRSALELRPDFADARAHLGEALFALGDREDGLAALRQALAAAPGLTSAWLDLGTFEARLGRPERAAEAFRRGLENDPDDPRLGARLAWILATAEDPALRDGDEAVRLALRACEATGFGLPEALDVLAAAQAESARFAAAAESARRARDLAARLGRHDLAAEIEARLGLYLAGRPYREGGTR